MNDPPVDALPAQAPAGALERHSSSSPNPATQSHQIAAPNPRHVDGQGFALPARFWRHGAQG
jgi:hypothetical protein